MVCLLLITLEFVNGGRPGIKFSLTGYVWLAGARFEPPDPATPGAAGLSLGEAVEQLVMVLQQTPPLPPPPDHATASLLLQWLQQVSFSYHILDGWDDAYFSDKMTEPL